MTAAMTGGTLMGGSGFTAASKDGSPELRCLTVQPQVAEARISTETKKGGLSPSPSHVAGACQASEPGHIPTPPRGSIFGISTRGYFRAVFHMDRGQNRQADTHCQS